MTKDLSGCMPYAPHTLYSSLHHGESRRLKSQKFEVKSSHEVVT